MRYDPKYYDKTFQAQAYRWWRNLSINQMKGYERQYGISQFNRSALPSEVAEIFDREGQPAPQELIPV